MGVEGPVGSRPPRVPSLTITSAPSAMSLQVNFSALLPNDDPVGISRDPGDVYS